MHSSSLYSHNALYAIIIWPTSTTTAFRPRFAAVLLTLFVSTMSSTEEPISLTMSFGLLSWKRGVSSTMFLDRHVSSLRWGAYPGKLSLWRLAPECRACCAGEGPALPYPAFHFFCSTVDTAVVPFFQVNGQHPARVLKSATEYSTTHFMTFFEFFWKWMGCLL